MCKKGCPLFLAYQSAPKGIFLRSQTRSFTYEDLESQTQYLMRLISNYPKQSVFSSQNNDYFFNTALLIACARLSHIYFPISTQLPPKVVEEYSKHAKVTKAFLDPFYGTVKKMDQSLKEIDFDCPVTYTLTSGSTSKPQICVHRFSNHVSNAWTSNAHLNFQTHKTWLCSLPLYHVSGLSLIFRALLAKATLAQKSDKIEKILENEQITHISLVPTQLKRLINQKSLQSVECILLGGAPLNPRLLEEAKEKKLNVFPTYGLTEMSSQVFTYCPQKQKMVLLPEREYKITKDKELLLKGATLFLGYLSDKGLIKPFDQEGWYATKDLAIIEKGDFVFLGRKDNLFISGGENIQPEEIERILLSHPSIEEAVVLPVKDEEFGHRPVAFIKAVSMITQASLESFLKPYLPKFKHPIEYHPLKYKGLKPSRKRLFSKLKKKYGYFKNN